MIYIIVIIFIVGAILFWHIQNRIATRVIQELEPQEGTIMRIRTKVYFKKDVIKQWDVRTTFSKVDELAQKQKIEGKSLINLYKKNKN